MNRESQGSKDTPRRKFAVTIAVVVLCVLVSSAHGSLWAQPVDAWSPTAIDQDSVVNRSTRYFSLKDQGRFRDAYGLMAPSLQKTMTLQTYQDLSEAFYSTSGPVKQRKIGKITWYKNPKSASRPGVYAKVDFSSHFRNIEMHCGFLIWHRTGTQPFSLMREEQAHIPNSILERLEPERLAEVKAQLGCG